MVVTTSLPVSHCLYLHRTQLLFSLQLLLDTEPSYRTSQLNWGSFYHSRRRPLTFISSSNTCSAPAKKSAKCNEARRRRRKTKKKEKLHKLSDLELHLLSDLIDHLHRTATWHILNRGKSRRDPLGKSLHQSVSFL